MQSLRTSLRTLILGAALLSGAVSAPAHGPWHEQLTALSIRLEAAPDDTQTRLARARLLAMHGDGLGARWDIELASRSGAPASFVALTRAELASSEQDWAGAAAEIPGFLDQLRSNPEALRLCARIHAARGEKAENIAALRTVVEQTTRPEPDDFLALARALSESGRTEEALGALDAGITRLGPAIGLFEAAIVLEEQRRDWNRAIARIEAASKHLPSSARWLARKAVCEEKAGHAESAANSRRAALQLLDALPEARRNAPANAELANALRAKLGVTAEK